MSSLELQSQLNWLGALLNGVVLWLVSLLFHFCPENKFPQCIIFVILILIFILVRTLNFRSNPILFFIILFYGLSPPGQELLFEPRLQSGKPQPLSGCL